MNINMKKIIINEAHIRKIVRETLENLMNTNIDVFNIIKNSELAYQPSININNNIGEIELVYKNNMLEDGMIVYIKFMVEGNVEPYHYGNYTTPPEGGECEITDMSPIEAKAVLNGYNEIEINVDDNMEELTNILNSYENMIYDNIDWEYFENEGPDTDYVYDMRKNEKF